MSVLQRVPRGKRWQRLWSALHTVALTGMNYGRGALEDDSDHIPARIVDATSRADRPVIFDGGAHFGTYTRNVLAVLPSARVLAFEPAQATFAQLQRNLSGAAELFPFGFSDATAEVSLYADDDTSTSASILAQDRSHWYKPQEFTARETIRVTTIDAFCAEHRIDRIDLLKLDVEGAELAALKGAKGMLTEGRIGLIQFEWGLPALSARVHLRDFFDLLDGWTIHRIVPDGIVPVVWHERWEIAWTTNYLATPPGLKGKA